MVSYQNNQVEESSCGVRLLPEIIERIKTECGGAIPSVKGNLSIVFSILSESHYFKQDVSRVAQAQSKTLQTKVDPVEEDLEINDIDVDGININGECFYWDYIVCRTL